jgi:hypothetical protein
VRIRLTAAVGMAAALLLLTSCRTDPNVAAYVGNTVITEERVTQLLDDYNKKVEEFNQASQAQTGQDGSQPQVAVPAERSKVVEVLVTGEMCDQLSKSKGFSYSAEPAAANAPELATIENKQAACFEAIPADPGSVTEKDLQDIFDRGLVAGLWPPGSKFSDAKQAWEADPELLGVLSREKSLAQVPDVLVNPRYGAISLPLLSSGVGARIGGQESGLVIDRPAESPEATPAPQ